MGAKFVRTTSTIYKRGERKLLPQHFTPCTVDVHPKLRYKNISLADYRVPRKTFKFVPVVPKAHGKANVCAHRKSIKLCNSKKMFWGLFIGMICSCVPIFKFFSTPPDGASQYRVSNLKPRIFRFSAHVLL